jgi:amino acid permease
MKIKKNNFIMIDWRKRLRNFIITIMVINTIMWGFITILSFYIGLLSYAIFFYATSMIFLLFKLYKTKRHKNINYYDKTKRRKDFNYYDRTY